MLRILALVVTIALGDSLNPSTIGPALYVASGDRARVGVLEFTLAVFVVHLVGGAVLVLGPGQLLLSVLNALSDTARAALEIAAVVAMIVAAASLWHQRGRLAQKELPNPNPKRKSSLLLGATIIAVELPTAFPYFAAIAATLGSGGGLPRQMLLIAVYNVCFVMPLVAILVTLLAFGANADHILTQGRQSLAQRWPAVFAGLLVAGGIVLGVVGGVGLTAA